jgi:hypothetical protein
MSTKTPRTTSNCSSETDTIYPHVIKGRKTCPQPTSYIPSALASVPGKLHGYPGDYAPCILPEAPLRRDMKRSFPETSCTPDLEMSPPVRPHTRTTPDAGLQSPCKLHHLAKIPERPKPKHKQIAVIKEEELKLRREEREGTPHISEMESDEDMINFNFQDLRLAGTTSFTIDQNLSENGGSDQPLH